MTALLTIYITRYNRRQTESNQTCLNCRGAKEEDVANRLIHSNLVGAYYSIASSAIYNIIHRAFRRCQTRAPVEGFVRFRQNIQNTLTLQWQNKNEVKYEKEINTIQMARHDASARNGNGYAKDGMGGDYADKAKW